MFIARGIVDVKWNLNLFENKEKMFPIAFLVQTWVEGG